MSAIRSRGEDNNAKILVFTTVNISDPGVDMAGSAHMHYPTSVVAVNIPCSSAIKPAWILHAIESGFDGVFIAADGTDCAFVPDCTQRTARIVQRGQDLLVEHGHDPACLRMAAICSVCAEAFVSHIEKFQEALGRVAAA